MENATSEIELLQGSVAGNREAFGAIIRRYQALVCAITYSTTGDVGTSEDLAQETFLRAWRNLRQLNDPGKFRAWLRTTARNLAHTSLRRRQRHVTQPLEIASELPAAGPRPDEAALAKERQEIVWSAVEGVPLEYREPLVLFYRRQQSVSEVAADLGLSEEAVRQRLHRGRELIKAEVSSLVEETLVRSGPGKTFAAAVMAALPALTTVPASATAASILAKIAPAAKILPAGVLSGAILAPILGFLGGLFGVWFSIKTDSPRERRLMIRVAIMWWVLFLMLIGLPLTLLHAGLIPVWGLGACLAAFFTLQLAVLIWDKARQRRIQIEEGPCRRPGDRPSRITQQSQHGSVAGGVFGGVFGGTGMLLYQAAIAKAWLSFSTLFACDILVFLFVTRFCLRKLQQAQESSDH